MVFTDVQSEKTLPKTSTPSSISIFLNPLHFQKHKKPSKDLTLPGILIERRDKQLEKALLSIFFKLCGNSIFLSDEQSLKAETPISSTPEGISIFSKN